MAGTSVSRARGSLRRFVAVPKVADEASGVSSSREDDGDASSSGNKSSWLLPADAEEVEAGVDCKRAKISETNTRN